MRRTITSWNEFKTAWGGVQNFLMAGECIPFSFDFPPIDEVVDELRVHPEAQVHPGRKGAVIDTTSAKDDFLKLPIAEAMETQFSIAHYHLSPFDKPGAFLHGFKEKVLDKWQAALAAQGFTWNRSYPIVFISGKDCATNYHMDYSHVVAWQVHGTKLFHGLNDPNRWAPYEVRTGGNFGSLAKPEAITEDDATCYEMTPGTMLWNTILTPHWVEAADEVAMSVNISHGGLRLNGELCPFEQELVDWTETHSENKPVFPAGVY